MGDIAYIQWFLFDKLFTELYQKIDVLLRYLHFCGVVQQDLLHAQQKLTTVTHT